MGLFKRAASAVNQADPATDLTLALSATILSVTRTTMFGLQTLNFDVELELADGSRALSKRDEVPSYAQWWVVPGAVVPAVVDPDDTTRASVDWPAFALAQREEVGFD